MVIGIDAKLGLEKTGKLKGLSEQVKDAVVDYYTKINKGYREIAKLSPDTRVLIKHIDGRPDLMHKIITAHVDKLLKIRNYTKSN